MSAVADSRNVLVIVTANGCGACTQFKKNNLDKLKKELQQSGVVRVEHIDVPAIGAPVPEGYPTQLNSWIRWYPTLILVNGKDWNEKCANVSNSSPPIEVFNGVVVDGKIDMARDSRKNYDELLNWIKDNIDNNTKFRTIVVAQTPQVNTQSVGTQKQVFVPTCGAIKISGSSRRQGK